MLVQASFTMVLKSVLCIRAASSVVKMLKPTQHSMLACAGGVCKSCEVGDRGLRDVSCRAGGE